MSADVSEGSPLLWMETKDSGDSGAVPVKLGNQHPQMTNTQPIRAKCCLSYIFLLVVNFQQI